MRPLGIYVHIPFCIRKCEYCDFLSMPANSDVIDRYIEALVGEIRGYADKYRCAKDSYKVRSIYFGGGTPSLLEPDKIGFISDEITRRFGIEDLSGIEFTLEANPGTVTYEGLKSYRKHGINRLSLGLQSADDNELRALGRIHDSAAFFDAYKMVLEAGFDNINVDIMTAIPGQTRESLERTLKAVTGLGCTHISAYSLIIEEGTPFYGKYRTGEGLPDEDEERAMYWFGVSYLKEHGYDRYEISNFAKPGYESRHNTSYWKRDDYIGFGLGASSLINEVRYKNTSNLQDYISSPVSDELFEEKIPLGSSERMGEYMFLGLRMDEGISEKEFENTFLKRPDEVYGEEIAKLTDRGLLAEMDGRIKLTGKGIDYGNYVFAHFL